MSFLLLAVRQEGFFYRGATREVTPGERRPSTRGRTRPYREAIGGSRNQEGIPQPLGVGVSSVAHMYPRKSLGTGLLVPPLDPGALAAALGRLADDAPRRLLGAAGRRRATLYTPERVATAFLRTVMEEGLLPARPGTSVNDLHRTGAA